MNKLSETRIDIRRIAGFSKKKKKCMYIAESDLKSC